MLPYSVMGVMAVHADFILTPTFMSFFTNKRAKAPPLFFSALLPINRLVYGLIVVTLASVLVQICGLRNVSVALFASLIITSVLVCVLPG